MSRSQPTDRSNNPATRWFEWDGENGGVRYYNKAEGKNIEIGDKMTFILLDELATVKGWHNDSDSGIYANEVRDTVQESLVVKAFKGGVIAQGFYRQIRDRIAAAGGKFVNNCYIAYKSNGELQIGSLQFKGAALNSWVEFKKAHRADLYKKAIAINGVETGKKGKITYCTPVFALREINEQTDNEAKALDGKLQEYLKSYFARTRSEQVAQPPPHEPEPEPEQERREPPEVRRPAPDPDLDPAPDDSDQIPF